MTVWKEKTAPTHPGIFAPKRTGHAVPSVVEVIQAVARKHGVLPDQPVFPETTDEDLHKALDKHAEAGQRLTPYSLRIDNATQLAAAAPTCLSVTPFDTVGHSSKICLGSTTQILIALVAANLVSLFSPKYGNFVLLAGGQSPHATRCHCNHGAACFILQSATGFCIVSHWYRQHAFVHGGSAHGHAQLGRISECGCDRSSRSVVVR